MRQAVPTTTKGEPARSSRLSRLAEEVGWGLRQEEPDSAEPDCLRDAANTFVYRPPGDLKPKAPATQLARSSHSFCRVFTGAFLKAPAGVFRLREKQDSEGLAGVSVVMGRLLVAAVLAAPVDTRYFAQVAAHLLAADRQLYGGAHLPALRTAFVQAGILSQDEAASLSVKSMAPYAKAIAKEIGKARPSGLGADLPTVTLASDPYGLTQELSVPSAVEAARFDVAGWDPLSGAAWGAGDPEHEAATFVSDLFALGHVVVPESCPTTAATTCEATGSTHEIVAGDAGSLTLNRLFFD
ncbi:hypothetical protein GCM10010211_84980 [Streptomyces albospinus]|uniref:Uncharacterized protein n=1 Tax=Streptomyces albospinus TaxID=285515 RepID=A0ABQ2VSN8_9ACTN|nr:hypothetical protein [Streptomyces albospinus]GGV04868.1 hypothetical protein GCM10010211_84980 [Streptomyces albospinus]